MDRSPWGMLIAVDVQYAERAAVTAAVGFIDWSTPTSTVECVLRAEVTPERYEPGAFYKRELPSSLRRSLPRSGRAQRPQARVTRSRPT
jgi:deoxyinosine 3'endonuclease (endonuclease V)